MLLRSRPALRAPEQGFTLIELLVVILIIGVLAGIAIPSLLNQRSKAYDASAKELARTAQTTAETYAIDHGSFTGMNLTELKKYETGLPSCPETKNACLSSVTVPGENEYTVTTEAATTKDKFTIARSPSGVVTRTCTSTINGCSGASSGSW
ncbi:MAG: type II secretion system protein [Solirubrobacteraceae bacterium]|jgi:type IV pilus assembly protein PilA